MQVGHELFPNFRLSVAAMDGRDLRSASKDFTVERELKVTVKPLKEAFLPGESGKVEITVTDQTGQPVEAELSLALVNESLFAVFPDSLTPIRDFFQKDARRYAEFKVGATCAFRYRQDPRRFQGHHGGTKPGAWRVGRLKQQQLDELRKEMAANQPAACRCRCYRCQASGGSSGGGDGSGGGGARARWFCR